jgi:hypothetical protein
VAYLDRGTDPAAWGVLPAGEVESEQATWRLADEDWAASPTHQGRWGLMAPEPGEMGTGVAEECLAVDSCLADEGWLASLTGRGGADLIGLALGSAAVLAAGPADRQRNKGPFDKRRSPPALRDPH